jgi:hypothetical protein
VCFFIDAVVFCDDVTHTHTHTHTHIYIYIYPLYMFYIYNSIQHNEDVSPQRMRNAPKVPHLILASKVPKQLTVQQFLRLYYCDIPFIRPLIPLFRHPYLSQTNGISFSLYTKSFLNLIRTQVTYFVTRKEHKILTVQFSFKSFLTAILHRSSGTRFVFKPPVAIADSRHSLS